MKKKDGDDIRGGGCGGGYNNGGGCGGGYNNGGICVVRARLKMPAELRTPTILSVFLKKQTITDIRGEEPRARD